MASSRIRIERLTFDQLDPRRRADRLRNYTVVLDGAKVAKIALGEWITISTDPGRHELHLVIDFARSPRLELHLGDGQEIRVNCWANANPLFWPYWLTLGRSRYIGISLTDSR